MCLFLLGCLKAMDFWVSNLFSRALFTASNLRKYSPLRYSTQLLVEINIIVCLTTPRHTSHWVLYIYSGGGDGRRSMGITRHVKPFLAQASRGERYGMAMARLVNHCQLIPVRSPRLVPLSGARRAFYSTTCRLKILVQCYHHSSWSYIIITPLDRISDRILDCQQSANWLNRSLDYAGPQSASLVPYSLWFSKVRKGYNVWLWFGAAKIRRTPNNEFRCDCLNWGPLSRGRVPIKEWLSSFYWVL